MDLESFRRYCLARPQATEDLPFDEVTLVFRIMGKIFALTDMVSVPFNFNLKCDPEYAVDLRERYECITPGWHMNKKHWITVTPDSTIDDNLIRELIDGSYEEVIKSLPKSKRPISRNP